MLSEVKGLMSRGQSYDNNTRSIVPATENNTKAIDAFMAKHPEINKGMGPGVLSGGWSWKLIEGNTEVKIVFVPNDYAPNRCFRIELNEFGPDMVGDFISSCQNFDWYYEMSDDHRVWKAGSAEHSRLIALADALSNLSMNKKAEIAESAGLNNYKNDIIYKTFMGK